MTLHSSLTNAEDQHPPGEANSSDPGSVGAYRGWIDTTTSGAWYMSIRNAANGAWERLVSRVGVRKNSTGSTYYRQRLNLIEGSNVTLTVSDDSGSEEVDITIASSGGGGGSGGLVLLESHTASTSSALNFTTRNATGQSGNTFQSDYDVYVIQLVSLVLDTNTAALGLEGTTDSGSNYITTGYITSLKYWGFSSGSGTLTDTARVLLTNSYGTGLTRDKLSGTVTVYDPLDSTNDKHFKVETFGPGSDSQWYDFKGGTVYDSTTTLNGFRVKPSSGNISTGAAYVYGVAKS